MGVVYKIAHDVELEAIECGECGIMFAMPKHRLDESRQRSNRDFFCPNGHCRVFKESEADRLRKMLESANRKNTELADRAARAEGERVMAIAREAKVRGEKKKLLARANAGVCPHCNRTFSQLARHMESKHKGEIKKGGER